MTNIYGYNSHIKGNKAYYESSGGDKVASSQAGHILEWLLDPALELSTFGLHVVWNLEKYVAPLLRILGAEACKILASSKHRVYVGNYSLFYIPERIFSVRNKTHRLNYYELEQYYPDEEDPNNASIIADAGRELRDTFRAIGLDPLTLTSPVAVFRDIMMRHMDIGKFVDIQEKYMNMTKYAYSCCGRSWTEAHKLGYFEKAYDYDITAAYPSVARNLYDWRYADIYHSKKYEPDATYGWLRGKVTINPDVTVSPIIYEAKDGHLSSRTGPWWTHLTLAEVIFINKWQIGTFDVQDAWYMRQKAPVRPFETVLDRLYAKRIKAANDLAKLLLKRISVGIPGLFLHVTDDGYVGEYFNPMWSSYITALTRLKVAEFIYRNKLINDVIHISTDGLLTTKKIDLSKELGMGCWRLSDECSALVVSSGDIWYGARHPRGLTLNQMLGLLKVNPGKAYYSTNTPRMFTLGDAINTGKYDKIGDRIDAPTAIDLIAPDHDRHFSKLPKSGGELLESVYESSPLEVGE